MAAWRTGWVFPFTCPVKVAACLYADVKVRGVFWRATDGPKHCRAPSLLRMALSSKVQLPREKVRENPGPAHKKLVDDSGLQKVHA